MTVAEFDMTDFLRRVIIISSEWFRSESVFHGRTVFFVEEEFVIRFRIPEILPFQVLDLI